MKEEGVIVIDSRSERFVTIDSSQIRRTGSDSLNFPGTSNAFQVLRDLARTLRNEPELQSTELAASLDQQLGELEILSEKAYAVLGEQAATLETLEALRTRAEDLMLGIETQLTDVQATDIPEAVLRLENSQALLQYTYAVTAQLNTLGILNFLR